ncbi:MAG: MFS transporter [Kineosporiaceae bacterium]
MQIATDAKATYRDVFAIAEFRALFGADLVSLLGDMLATVVVTYLLFERTGSPLIASLGLAIDYVPWLVGGPLLSAWADRFPPRTVLVGCDVVRAVLIALAAIPGIPLALAGLFILGAAMLGPPFDSTVSGVTVDVLPGDTYAVGSSIRSMVHQTSMIVGFLAGGALLLFVGSSTALLLDALTFAVSAVLIRFGLKYRPAPAATGKDTDGDAVERRTVWRDTFAAARVLAGRRDLRVPLLLFILGPLCTVAPIALAAAWSDEMGRGPETVGLTMTVVAVGGLLGSFVLGRFVGPGHRERLLGPLTVAAGLTLTPLLLRPPVPVALALFTLSGALAGVGFVARAMLGRALPEDMRSRGFGLAMSLGYGTQMAGIVGVGALASLWEPHLALAAVGAIAFLATVPLLVPAHSLARALEPEPEPAPAV